MEKNVPPNVSLFNGKNLAQFVFMFETQSYCESEVPNEGSSREQQRADFLVYKYFFIFILYLHIFQMF